MKTSEKIAFYPGTFDPFTLGHASITRRALQIFDKVIIAVGINDAKRCLYTPDQRVNMLRELFASDPRVEVIAYKRPDRGRSTKTKRNGNPARNTFHCRFRI